MWYIRYLKLSFAVCTELQFSSTVPRRVVFLSFIIEYVQGVPPIRLPADIDMLPVVPTIAGKVE
jgi:hypothetical protein